MRKKKFIKNPVCSNTLAFRKSVVVVVIALVVIVVIVGIVVVAVKIMI